MYELLHKPGIASNLISNALQKVNSEYISTIIAEQYKGLYSAVLWNLTIWKISVCSHSLTGYLYFKRVVQEKPDHFFAHYFLGVT